MANIVIEDFEINEELDDKTLLMVIGGCIRSALSRPNARSRWVWRSGWDDVPSAISMVVPRLSVLSRSPYIEWGGYRTPRISSRRRDILIGRYGRDPWGIEKGPF